MTIRTALATTALVTALTVAVGARGTASGNNGNGGGPPGPVDCETARCAVQPDIDACGCDTAISHGAYVRCVAHAAKAAASGKKIPRRCKGKIVRCAARSTCGRTGAVTCVFGSRCRVRSSAAACTTLGGTPGPAGSCCVACGSPSGAFLDR